MRATEVLRNEHRMIEEVLDSLEKMLERGCAEGCIERQPAEIALAFLHDFGDRCHHEKEESYLYPAAGARGIPLEQGPLGAALRDHEQARALLRGMKESLCFAAEGRPESLRQFLTYGRAYVNFRREHIRREDYTMFDMIDRALNEEDHCRLVGTFEQVEVEEIGEGNREKYTRIADELAKQFAADTDPEPVETVGAPS